jgi:hypothetical protein
MQVCRPVIYILMMIEQYFISLYKINLMYLDGDFATCFKTIEIKLRVEAG